MKRYATRKIAELQDENNGEDINGDLAYFIHTSAALDRLAELEAVAHERRWRKIVSEGLPEVQGEYQFADEKEVLIIDWGEKTTSYEEMKWVKNHATHWRPQQNDLPTEPTS